MTKGSDRPVVFRRRIRHDVILRSMAIVFTGAFIVFAASCILSLTNGVSAMESVYESVSAYATVGLSLGITSGLNILGKVLIIILMFLGRVGTLTVLLSVARKSSVQSTTIDYPEARFMIG